MRFKNFAISFIVILLLSACADNSAEHNNSEVLPVSVIGPHGQSLKGTVDIVPLGGLIKSFKVTDGSLICSNSLGASSISISLTCNDGRHGYAIFLKSSNDGYIRFDDGTYVKFVVGEASSAY